MSRTPAALDYYERHLLALAVEACEDVRVARENEEWVVMAWKLGHGHIHTSSEVLERALTALLTDLRVQVPERPSEEAVDRALATLEDRLNVAWALHQLRTSDQLLAEAALASGRW